MPKEILTLDVEAIRELSNYAHWIPVIHGYMREFLDREYPGWEWNELIPKMLARGIIRTEPHAGDVKLWQGLWLKSGISQIVVTKSSKRITLECIEEVSDIAVTVKG